MALAAQFFQAIRRGEPAAVPQYDKSAFAGAGDRAPPETWERVNEPGQPRIAVVIFEGWCVGFRPLTADGVEARWRTAVASSLSATTTEAGPLAATKEGEEGTSRAVAAAQSTLAQHKLEHLLFVNERLRAYDEISDLFDAFIHIDAEDTRWVYDWRQEQEVMLRRDKGTGMTGEQVIRFVDAYYPAYELYSDKLRQGALVGKPGCQLRLVVGKDRKVRQKIII